MHLTPEGLPSGIPGIGDEIDIAMQQAPQFFLHSILIIKCLKIKITFKKTKYLSLHFLKTVK